MFNLDKPVVVCISDKTCHSISRDLVLEFDVRDRWPKIMRVEVLVCNDVPQSDFHPSGYVLEGLISPFCLGVPAFLG